MTRVFNNNNNKQIDFDMFSIWECALLLFGTSRVSRYLGSIMLGSLNRLTDPVAVSLARARECIYTLLCIIGVYFLI